MNGTFKLTVPARVVGFLEGTGVWEDLGLHGETLATRPTTAAAFLAIMNGKLKARGAIEAVFTAGQLRGLQDYVDTMHAVSDDDPRDRRCASDFSLKIDKLLRAEDEV